MKPCLCPALKHSARTSAVPAAAGQMPQQAVEEHEHKKLYYFTTGQRSSVKLVYQQFHFVKFMENSKGVKWICATRSSTKCRARLRTMKSGELEVLCPEHNHQPNKCRSKPATSDSSLTEN